MSEHSEESTSEVVSPFKAAYSPPELVAYGRATDLIETVGTGGIDDGTGAPSYVS
jgi:hypothetical protein